MFNGKTHYFNGHFRAQTVSLPEGLWHKCVQVDHGVTISIRMHEGGIENMKGGMVMPILVLDEKN